MDKYTQQKPGAAEIRSFIVERLASMTGLQPSKIKPNTEFISLGLDSADAASLSGELGEWLNIEFEENLLWEHPTTDELVEYLAEIV